MKRLMEENIALCKVIQGMQQHPVAQPSEINMEPLNKRDNFELPSQRRARLNQQYAEHYRKRDH